MTTSIDSQSLNSMPKIDFGARFQTPSFTVIVGRSKKPYYVNEFLLTATSTYFKRIRSLQPDESSEVITLPTEIVATEIAFEKFFEYVCLGDYKLGNYASTYAYDKSLSEEMQMKLHAQVYVLAEKLMMKDLKECALEKMIATMTQAYTAEQPQAPRDTRNIPRSRTIYSGGLRGASAFAATAGSAFGSSATSASAETIPSGSSEPSKSVTIKRSKIRATCLADLVDLFYGKTSDNSIKSNTKAENDEKTRDPMRVLIARFAASCLDDYKRDTVFLKLLRGDDKFAEDLLLELAGVDKVQLNERTRLP
ncbi:hypothetical protein RUND412_002339 [Rhizina undulata]